MNTMTPTLHLACELINKKSVTPDDAGCQDIMIQRLENIGFKVTKLKFGEVDNFWAVRGNTGKTLAFAGHTDVVPSGNESDWQLPPYKATIVDGMLCGRGAADMKSSLAAMIVAAEKFISDHPKHNHRLAFLITSDEEGIATHGTVKVIEHLKSINEDISWCVVGEPSSTEHTGDVIKNGRRGSLGLKLTIQGTQGHVAYPHLAENPIHLASPALVELTSTQWDKGNDFFPATTFQISNITSGTGATNVIPGTLEAIANFRFSTELNAETIKNRTIDILDKHKLNYKIEWTLNGLPFLTKPGTLVNATIEAIKKANGIDSKLSTTGGTSDGRFIAPTGAQVVEIGPVNATIHKVDERVRVDELEELTDIYQSIMINLLTK